MKISSDIKQATALPIKKKLHAESVKGKKH